MSDWRFRIAIPSYKRAGTLLKKTLRFLQRQEVPVDAVDIFLASEEELAEYRRICGTAWHYIVGVPGIHRQREFIHTHYAEGAWILCLDDDVSGWKTLYPGVPFQVLIERCFEIAAAEGCRLWGVYPTDFGPQLRDRYTKGLVYILGSFFGMINWHPAAGAYPHATTEDITRSIQRYLADGAVLRFDGVGPHTLYFTEPGGLQEYRTPDRQRAEMEALVARYPDHVVLRQKHDTYVDVRVTRQPKTRVQNPFLL